MKSQPVLRLITVIVVLSLAILACGSATSTATPPPEAPTSVREAEPSPTPEESPTHKGCAALEASEVAWVTLTESGEVDQQVDSYPDGAALITPLFQYNCVPKKITVVTVFTLNGKTVFTDKDTLKASTSKGFYAYPLGSQDNSALEDGEWGVEFYNNKTLLTSGTVTVGGEATDSGNQTNNTVTVQGTVKDARTKKPIKGAVVLVLNSGTSVQQFIDGGQPDAEVFTVGRTDSQGEFTLDQPLERNTEYSLVITAKGYKPIGQDGFVIDDKLPEPVELNVKLSK
jgi:hypothetical protein